MEREQFPNRIGSPPRLDSAEDSMLRAEVVREILARLARGEGVKRIARELDVDRKTVKHWRRLGQWQPRQSPPRPRQLDGFRSFLEARGPEVGWNGMVLWRELQAQGFTGGYLQIQRYLQPRRTARRWAAEATVRFETAPGEQAQVDFGQSSLWIGDQLTRIHLFVLTLGFSRRLWVQAYPHERVDLVVAGHEGAFRHFGGVPLECLYDNPRTLVLGRRDGQVLWHPAIEDLARYYGFTPRACRPYRARTKGKVERSIQYVKRNALAGRRFASWDALNAWLLDWCLTVADVRVHGTTHERPIDRFAREGLTPLGLRPPFRFERVRLRQVPADALVAIAGARYSVPVQYVGATVAVHETATHYELLHQGTAIARHAKHPRHTVVMEPAHYAGLLRAPRPSGALTPPRWDLTAGPLADVAVRDLATYAAVAEEGAR